MRIKNIYGYFIRTMSLILCCMLTFVACVNEDEAPSPDERGQEMVDLLMNMANRSGTAGSDNEIKKIRIIAFDSRSGELVYNQKIDNPAENPVTIQIMSGIRDFYVITNEPASQTTVLNNVQILNELQSIRIPWNEIEQENTFVTFGTLLAKTIKPKEANTITVKNHRLAVKIVLTLNGKNFTPAQEVNFRNLPDAVPLFEIPYDCAESNRRTKTVTPLTDPDSISPGYVWTRTATVVLPSYLFTPKTDTDKAVQISVPIGSGEVGETIAHSVSGSDYTLQRNTIYSLTANVGPDKLMIEAQVRNWDENKTDYPAGGGSFWEAQPQDKRVGLNGTTDDATAVFTAGLSSSGTVADFKWYCKKQLADFSFETTEITTGISTPEANKSQLTIVATSLDDACEVYCVATVTAPDGKTDRLESERATFMVMGDWVEPSGTYPSMQNWKAPLNAPLGSTCLLQDDRDDKVYRVKLMADGNWWMIQDLAYGNASSLVDFKMNSLNKEITDLIETGAYGVCTSSENPMGGYLYNAYAVAQIPEPSETDANHEIAKNISQYQSLCPAGWHLPGNIDNIYNEEWNTLQRAIGVDNTKIMDEFVKFGYNDPTHFGAYNLKLANPTTMFAADNISFAGGLYIAIVAWDLGYGFLGFTSIRNLGAITNTGQAFPPQIGAPIRCLRNFK